MEFNTVVIPKWWQESTRKILKLVCHHEIDVTAAKLYLHWGQRDCVWGEMEYWILPSVSMRSCLKTSPWQSSETDKQLWAGIPTVVEPLSPQPCLVLGNVMGVQLARCHDGEDSYLSLKVLGRSQQGGFSLHFKLFVIQAYSSVTTDRTLFWLLQLESQQCVIEHGTFCYKN